MLNWFKKSNEIPESKDNVVEPVEEKSSTIPPITLPPLDDNGYTVGYNNGSTILKLKAGNNYMTLSLPPEEVYRLIRLLAASLDEDELFDDEHDEHDDDE